MGSSPESKVFALVGLNESGKTTVLEAINHFSYKSENLAPLEASRLRYQRSTRAYAPSKLENIPDVVMVEGKNDYYTLQFMQRVTNHSPSINLLPGTSSGNLDGLIRLYLAWGKQFLVLLDADAEGTKQKERYEKIFESSVQGRVFTLAEIDSSWAFHEMEALFSDAEKLAIQSASYPGEAQFNKTHFNRAIQEHLLTKKVVSVSNPTQAKFQNIFDFIASKFSKVRGR